MLSTDTATSGSDVVNARVVEAPLARTTAPLLAAGSLVALPAGGLFDQRRPVWLAYTTAALAVVALAVVAALGSWLPARRATRGDPILVLHEESAL